MTLRTRLTDALKQALKARDGLRLSTLRLVSAALKDREIALRGEGEPRDLTDADVLAVLARMVKQRQDSAAAYDAAARADLAGQERGEIAVINEFLPQQLSGAEIEAAVLAAINDLGATSIRDMGRVMSALKERHTGQMDFGAVGALVKARLGTPAA